MRSLSIKRGQGARNTARFFSQPPQRKMLVNQTKGASSHSDIAKLEAFPMDPIQCIDAASEHFGKFWYLAGYDEIGDPNHPVAP